MMLRRLSLASRCEFSPPFSLSPSWRILRCIKSIRRMRNIVSHVIRLCNKPGRVRETRGWRKKKWKPRGGGRSSFTKWKIVEENVCMKTYARTGFFFFLTCAVMRWIFFFFCLQKWRGFILASVFEGDGRKLVFKKLCFGEIKSCNFKFLILFLKKMDTRRLKNKILIKKLLWAFLLGTQTRGKKLMKILNYSGKMIRGRVIFYLMNEMEWMKISNNF